MAKKAVARKAPAPAPQVPEQDRILSAIGLRIKHARMLRAMTLKALADEAGWSESMLSRWSEAWPRPR